MGRIKEALGEEEKYVKERLLGRESSLLERLRPFGYDSLDKFFSEKKEYQFQNLSIKRYDAPVDTCLDVLFNLVKKEEPSVLIVPSDKVFVYHGDEPYNKEYCTTHNIPVFEVGHHGGTIVGGPDDIAIGIIVPNYIDIDNTWILEHYRSMYIENGQNVEINNNDLMIGSHKIMGSATLIFDNVTLYVANFSFSDTSKYIEQICQVPREKEPSFLSSQVMTRKELEEGVVKWLLKN